MGESPAILQLTAGLPAPAGAPPARNTVEAGVRAGA